MGQLEIQDGFAPYFDSNVEIEMTTVETSSIRFSRRLAAKVAAKSAAVRKIETSTPASPAAGRQME